jgi:hypothetical protein
MSEPLYDGLPLDRATFLLSLYEIADAKPHLAHPREYDGRRFGIGTRTVKKARAEGWTPPWEAEA